MKVKALQDYFDIELNRAVKKLDEYEVSEARAKILSTTDNKAGVKLVEILEATTPTPKKASGKKAKK